jgi:methyltransferase-like protein/SAM-dependent methyltransferase
VTETNATIAASAANSPRTADAGEGGVRVCSYDEVPYSVGSFPQTQPDRLATLATLFGLEPAPPETCRVLELGCAAGGNLIPMALAAPRSAFMGIDLSQRQIAQGEAMVQALHLGNVELRPLSILDVDDSLGTFDYILVHGVYSWVPAAVQDKILEICRRNLNPNGLAYVSYNTYPGWHARGAVREMLWYHTQHIADPLQRISQARALLAFLAKAGAQREMGYSLLLRQEMALLLRVPDSYLLHEHLEEFNEPLYFHQFAQRCAAKGLQYLAEAQLSTMMPGRFGDDIDQTLRKISSDLLHLEQYMDFLSNRMFRQTLLCHANRALDFKLRASAVRKLRVASAARCLSETPEVASAKPEQYRVPGSTPTLTTPDPLMKSALLVLNESWPLSTPFESLVREAQNRNGREKPDDAAQLAGKLMNCYASGLVELSLLPPGFVTSVSDAPIASPYARLRAADSGKVTNMRLESVMLGEPSRFVLRHLDGRHDRAALGELIARWMKENSPEHPIERAGQYIDQLLPAFARSALLIG